MIGKIDISPYVSAGTIADIIAIQKRIAGGAVRLVRLPVEEFGKAIESVFKANPYMPFQPMIRGIPVDQSTGQRPEVVVVYDDDTNVAKSVKSELEVG